MKYTPTFIIEPKIYNPELEVKIWSLSSQYANQMKLVEVICILAHSHKTGGILRLQKIERELTSLWHAVI